MELSNANSTAEIANMASAPTLSSKRIARIYELYGQNRARHPEHSHNDLRRMFRNDERPYLTKELLSDARVEVAPLRKRVAEQNDLPLIQSLIAHIEHRSRQLRAAEHPYRIGISTLMRTFHHPRIFQQKRLVQRLAPAHEVLHQHIESHAQWHERMEAIEARKSADRRRDARRTAPTAATKDAADQEN